MASDAPTPTYESLRNQWLWQIATVLGMVAIVVGMVISKSQPPPRVDGAPVGETVAHLVFSPFWAGVGHFLLGLAVVFGILGGSIALVLRSHCLLAPLTRERLAPAAYARGLDTLWSVPMGAAFLACGGLILSSEVTLSGPRTAGMDPVILAVVMVTTLVIVLLAIARPEKSVFEWQASA